MTCCFTGHRSFPWKDDTEHPQHKALLAKLERSIDLALAKGATHFICGNAIGVDTWAAELVLKKKRTHPQIFLEIALPFAGHNANEPACQRVQQKADLVHVVGRAKNRRSAFFERNRYMVDHSEYVITYFDGAVGGTRNTLDYAKRKNRVIVNLADEEPLHPKVPDRYPVFVAEKLPFC